MSETVAMKETKEEKSGKDLNTKPRKRNQPKKGWRDVFVWVIPTGIGIVLAAIGLFYFVNRPIAIALVGVTLILFAGFFLFLAEWYVWKTKKARKKPRMGFAMICCLVVAGSGVWEYRSWVNAPQPFLATVASQLGSYKSERGGVFWAIYNTGYGETVAPAQLGLYIEIINRQSVPAVIDSYTVEAQNRAREWFKLTRVDGGSGDVFFCIDDLHKAKPIDLSENGLDKQMREKAIAAHSTMKGWAFFELPQDIRDRSPFRITIEDNTGMTAAQITEGGDNLIAPKDYVQDAPLHLAAGLKDLTSYRFQMYSEIFRKGNPN